MTLDDARRLAADELMHASIPEFREALKLVLAEVDRRPLTPSAAMRLCGADGVDDAP